MPSRTSSARKSMTVADYDYAVKCIVLGDSGVGKTSLVQRLNDNGKRTMKTTPTVEGIYHAKSLKIDQRTIQLSIWDTAGQEAFRSVTRIYYRGASCAIIIYDVTRRSTFNSLQSWLDDLKAHSSNSKAVLVLVANKCDLVDERAVSHEEGQLFARRHQMSYLETSAEKSTSINSMLELVSQEVYNNIKIGSIVPNPESNGIRVGRKPSASEQEDERRQKSSCGC
ncbi:ras-related protein Rab-2A-like [Watersipora subatra]|uniref:ras-related protein Rab-2A-like n=1 Tax=Watersipora subatra TaxID=2589382 RepID=UPI00355C29FF